MKKRMLYICLAVLMVLGAMAPAGFATVGAEPFRTEPMIVTSENHAVAVRNDGTVWAWGDNSFGALGSGAAYTPNSPVQTQGIDNVIAVATESNHSLALQSNGTVWAWGSNGLSQLGPNGSTTWPHTDRAPVHVSGLNNIVAIEAGVNYSVALRNDGTVWAWGNNSLGTLGNGTTIRHSTPQQVSGLNDVVAISSGAFHVVALRSDGTVWAWGDNRHGQLGVNGNTESPAQNATPIQVAGLNNVTAIAAGQRYTLALLSDGTLRAWGLNRDGQLGDGTTTSRTTPVQVLNLNNVSSISAGWDHSVARLSDGTLRAWGRNGFGQLGDDTRTHHTTPVPVLNLNHVTTMAAGGNRTFAVRNDGTVWAWGYNNLGRLNVNASGSVVSVSTPMQVVGPDRVGYLNLLVDDGTSGGATFADVRPDNWFYTAVGFVSRNGIMQGTADNQFAPNMAFSRAMVVTTLFRMYHDRVAAEADPAATPFDDVAEGRWYAPYIAWAHANGIVRGVSDTQFAPQRAVSRQEFATMMYRFAAFMELDTAVSGDPLAGFADAGNVQYWARDAMVWAIYSGLIQGTDRGLEPQGTATRAQAATILMRFYPLFN